jgi:transcriptional regulator with XRE-family HTH domain
MKDRIAQFLKSEGISPAEFADKIGVQRSSVSHVLNGRNHPSASFIQKLLGSYKSLNPRWLLLGEGTISDSKYSPVREQVLFGQKDEPDNPKPINENVIVEDKAIKEISDQLFDNMKDKYSSVPNSSHQVELNLAQSLSEMANSSIDYKEVDRIVFFFRDKTFTAYTPSK